MSLHPHVGGIKDQERENQIALGQRRQAVRRPPGACARQLRSSLTCANAPLPAFLCVASASVRKTKNLENVENVGGGESDVLRLRGRQRPRETEPLLPQLLSGVIPDFG